MPIAVCNGLAVRNLQEDFPYLLPERRADGMQRRQKIRLFPAEINIKPAHGFREYRRFLFRTFRRQAARKIFLPVKPEPHKSGFIRREQNSAERGTVMLNVCHFYTSENY